MGLSAAGYGVMTSPFLPPLCASSHNGVMNAHGREAIVREELKKVRTMNIAFAVLTIALVGVGQWRSESVMIHLLAATSMMLAAAFAISSSKMRDDLVILTGRKSTW